jgi:hypothetical protein
VLGAVVAVVAHFLSHTVPPVYYITTLAGQGSDRQLASVATPFVHPSWWPSLPAAIGIGLLVGLFAAVAADRLGVRIHRATPGDDQF